MRRRRNADGTSEKKEKSSSSVACSSASSKRAENIAQLPATRIQKLGTKLGARELGGGVEQASSNQVSERKQTWQAEKQTLHVLTSTAHSGRKSACVLVQNTGKVSRD